MRDNKSLSNDYIMRFKDILYHLILEKIGRKNLKILDVGCKDGDDLAKICSRGHLRGYGLDIDFHKAWLSRPDYNFIQASAEKIPFKDDSFDFILISEVIEHLSGVSGFISQARRALKSGGYFFITTPSRYNYPSLLGNLIPKPFKDITRRLIYYRHSAMSGIKKKLADGSIIKEHVCEFLPIELKRMLEAAGFKTEEVKEGFLHVPIAPLFDKLPFLIKCWHGFDNLFSVFWFSIYFKSNFIVVARKA